MALALAAGATLAEAARLANEAAGIAVGKFGPAVVTPAELLRALDASAASCSWVRRDVATLAVRVCRLSRAKRHDFSRCRRAGVEAGTSDVDASAPSELARA